MGMITHKERLMAWAINRAALELASYRESSYQDALEFIVAEALEADYETEPDDTFTDWAEVLNYFDDVVKAQTKAVEVNQAAESGVRLSDEEVDLVVSALYRMATRALRGNGYTPDSAFENALGIAHRAQQSQVKTLDKSMINDIKKQIRKFCTA